MFYHYNHLIDINLKFSISISICVLHRNVRRLGVVCRAFDVGAIFANKYVNCFTIST